MSEANDVKIAPPRIGARARAAVVVDLGTDVAVFGAVLGIGALIVVLCSVAEVVSWAREERR